MRLITWSAFIAICAVVISWLFANNHGHVTMYWQAYRIDLSMNLFLILGFVGFYLIFNCFKFISFLIELPERAKNYRKKHIELRAFHDLQHAVEHLFAGRYAKSLKFSQASMQFQGTAQVSYMLAAQASHQLKQYVERDVWLEKISEDQYKSSKYILKAQMLNDQRQAQEALDSLSQIQKNGARQFLVQALAMRSHQILQQWPEVLRITNSLLKKNYLPIPLGKARIQEALTQWIKSGRISESELHKLWIEFDVEYKKNPHWLKLFAQGFIAVGDFLFAKKILDQALDNGANDELLSIYPLCSASASSDVLALNLIQKVESWLQKEPAHPALHLALGQLCQQSKLWGKAISSYQKVSDSPRVTQDMMLKAQFGLMCINEVLEDYEKSATLQKEVLRLMLNSHPII
jgi:HemY protein